MVRYTILPPLAVLTLLGILAGCELLQADDDAVAVEVLPDRPSYVMSDTSGVMLRVHNRSSLPLYFGGCDQQRVERAEGGRVVETVTTVYLCECICIVEVEPGAASEFRYHLAKLKEILEEREAGGETSFRVWPVVYSTQEFDRPVPRDQIDVTPFTVEHP